MRPDDAGTAPDVRLELTHGPGGPGVLADGRALTVPPHASATDVGLAAARRHAARSGRDLLVEVVDGASVTTVSVGPHGFVTLVSAPPRPEAPESPPSPFLTEWVEAPRTEVSFVPPATVPPPAVPSPRTETTPPVGGLSPWARPAPAATTTGRPMASLVVTTLVAAAVLVGAVGTGVATLASSQDLAGSCRPVTVYAVSGEGGNSDVLRGVTDPLAAQFGEKISVVTVPAPPTGGSYASAESEAVSSLARSVGDHVDGCPTGALMLFGYSQGAQVAGDLASRVGTGLEPRIPANLVQAVGLFGDPARSPQTRAVPEGTTGQGALPPRAVGFGSLDARTIQICAPSDPVCDSPATAAAPALEQAIASPVHGSYQQLPVAAGTMAPQWASASLGKVVAAIPTDAGPAKAPAGTTAQSGGVTTTTPDAGGSTTATAGGGGSTTTAGGSGASATGGSGDGGGVATRRSGSTGTRTGSSTRAPSSGASGADSTSGSASSTGAGAATGSGAATPTTSAPASTGTGGDSGSYGSESGSASVTTGSATPSESPSGSGSATGSASPTTSSSSSSRTGESGATSSGGGVTGAVTGAAWSLASGLEGFKSTPWNNQNATDPSAAPSPNVQGREAVKFEMPGGGKRTEAEPDVPEFQDGEKAFVGYSGFFDKGFPTDTDTWQLIMQFKQPGTGSPPLAVEVGKGQLRLANNGGGEKDFCPVTDGAFSFQLGIQFGGAIDAWCNGEQTLTGYTTPQSNVKGSAYLKTGIYRDESIKQESTLFLNDLKVGKTLEQVSGLAGASSGSGATSGSAGGASGATSTADDASAAGTTTTPSNGSTGTAASGTAASSTATGASTSGTGSAPKDSPGSGSGSGSGASSGSSTSRSGSVASPAVASSGAGSSADAAAAAAASPADAGPATARAGAGTATTSTGGTSASSGQSTGTTSGGQSTGTTSSGQSTGGQVTGGRSEQSGGGKKICDKFGSTDIDGGRFMVQNNEWGASDGQCVTPTTQGFTVDSGNHAKNDAPAAYPSIMSGCWMGTCTQGTTLPTRIGDLGPISSSIAGTIPEGTTSNLAYDLWADGTARKTGHNDAMELMIWLKETGGIKPIGQQAGTAAIGGATWDVWKGTNGGVNVISYVRQGYVDQANDLPLTDFVKDAVAQGSVQATDFLTNIQAGFEPWTGGPGMALDRFDVSYGGGAATSTATSPVR